MTPQSQNVPRNVSAAQTNNRNNNNNNSNINQRSDELTRSYTREEWDNLTPQQCSRIYRARERMSTARTVAALLQSQNQAIGGNIVQDDISA
jgi:acetyl-CoA carboxylase alpha subunit